MSTILFICLVGWLVVFNVPSTSRSFRDGIPIYCEGREARFLHHPHWESNPRSLRGSPLGNRCATPAPLLSICNWILTQ